MQNFPEISTQRLILNQPTIDDREDLILYLNASPEFAENTLTMPYPYTKESADFWVKIAEDGFNNRNTYIFAIRLKENQKIIGGIGLHLTPEHQKAEVGYWIAKPFQSNGYVTEALKPLIRFGFEELALNKIYASFFPHNPASGRVLQKCRMQFETVLKQEYVRLGKLMDVHRYCILKEDFQNF